MNKKRAMLLALAVVVAPAPGQSESDRPFQTHPPVSVYVTAGKITGVSEKDINTYSYETDIVWWIENREYEFPDKNLADGIIIRDMNGKPTNHHDCFRAPNAHRWYQCRKMDGGFTPGNNYKYTVNVVDTQTNKLVDPPLDPFIHNK